MFSIPGQKILNYVMGVEVRNKVSDPWMLSSIPNPSPFSLCVLFFCSSPIFKYYCKTCIDCIQTKMIVLQTSKVEDTP